MKKYCIGMVLGLCMMSSLVFGACTSKKASETQAETTMESVQADSVQAESTQAESTGNSSAQSSAASEQSVAGGDTTSPALGDGPAFHMKETENNLPANKAPNLNAAKEAVISVYVPSEGDKGIYMDFGSVPVMEAQAIVNQLVEYGVLPQNSSVLSYEAEGVKATLNLVGIDLSKRRTVVCVANTFLENMNLESITIVAGDEVSKDTQDMRFVAELDSVQ